MVSRKLKRCLVGLFALACFFMVKSIAGYSSDFSTSAEIHLKGGTASIFRFTSCVAFKLRTFSGRPLIVLEHVAPAFILATTRTATRVSALVIENPHAPMITLPEWRGSVAGLLAAASAQSRFTFRFYPERNCIHIIEKELVNNADWPLNDYAPGQIRDATSVGDLYSQLDWYSGVDIKKSALISSDMLTVSRILQSKREMLATSAGVEGSTIRDYVDRLLLANALPESNLYAEIQAVSDESYPFTDGKLTGGKMRFIIRPINISCNE